MSFYESEGSEVDLSDCQSGDDLENDEKTKKTNVGRSLASFSGFRAIFKRLFTNWSRPEVIDDGDVALLIEYLDTLLEFLLLPYYVSKYLYNNPHIVEIIKIIILVSLEAFMWLVFAGVSMLIAIKSIIEDHYHQSRAHGNDSHQTITVTTDVNIETIPLAFRVH